MSKITMTFSRMESTMVCMAIRAEAEVAYQKVKAMLDVPWDERDGNWTMWYEKERANMKRWTDLRNSVWEQEKASRKTNENPYI